MTPDGSHRGRKWSPRRQVSPLRPLRGRKSLRSRFRGYRCAQPPANGWHPSGMKSDPGLMRYLIVATTSSGVLMTRWLLGFLFAVTFLIVSTTALFAEKSVATPTEIPSKTDWPRWRGPNADGVADGHNL